MNLFFDLQLHTAWAASAAISAIVFTLACLMPAGDGATSVRDMAAVERLLTAHGLPVEGFAETAPVNLDAIDAMAPPECAAILRKAYLAKLAVIRMVPQRAADAAKIGRAVRFTLAQDAGTPGCAQASGKTNPSE